MPAWLCRLLPFLCATPPAPGPPPGPAPPPVPPGPIAPADLVAAINAARAAAGLAPLAHDPLCDEAASGEVALCVKNGTLYHYDFPGRISAVHPGTAAGENIAKGYPTAAEVVAGWMGEKLHRDNVLGQWDLVGCASGVGRDGKVYVSADFDKE